MDFYMGGAIACFILFLLFDVDEKFNASSPTYRYLAILIVAAFFPLTLPIFIFTEIFEQKEK